MLKHIFWKNLPAELRAKKGKLYIIYRGMPNTPDTTEVLHGVLASRAPQALSRRSQHNMKAAWLALRAKDAPLGIHDEKGSQRRYVNITLIKNFERHFDIVHHERLKPTAKDKPKWRSPKRTKEIKKISDEKRHNHN